MKNNDPKKMLTELKKTIHKLEKDFRTGLQALDCNDVALAKKIFKSNYQQGYRKAMRYLKMIELIGFANEK